MSSVEGYEGDAAASATLQDMAEGQEAPDEPEDDALIFETCKGVLRTLTIPP